VAAQPDRAEQSVELGLAKVDDILPAQGFAVKREQRFRRDDHAGLTEPQALGEKRHGEAKAPGVSAVKGRQVARDGYGDTTDRRTGCGEAGLAVHECDETGL